MKCPKCKTDNPSSSKYCAECATPLPSSQEMAFSQAETLQTPINELTTGSIFAGRYHVIEELGRGGMGKVYKVFDTKINEKVALKLIRPEIALDREILERFSNEMKLARKIGHRNVCRMFDLGEAQGLHFLTMEYVSGEDLKSMIRMSGTLSIGTALSLGKQVADGLAEAHSLGVIHRDLKPQNVMIDKGGNAKIMDFGIARSIREKGLTGPGVMVGTPEYMSPEQAEAKPVDERSDIYSLGIILYEMVTGRVPFEGDTALSIAMKHKGEVPKAPKELNSSVSDDLNGVILKCIEKSPGKRYASAAEVRDELVKIEKGLPTTERIAPKPKTGTSREITVKFRLRKAISIAFGIVFLLAAALVLWKVVLKKPLPLLPEQKRSIAVISFENQTGDKAYDYLSKVIPNLLITSLEQSGYFSVTTWERIYDLLKQAGKSGTDFVDRDLGFELCQKDGVEIIVLGSVTKAGNAFVTDAKVLEVGTKKLLGTANARGDSPDSILKNQVDDLSGQIAQGIGLSRQKYAATAKRVGDLTTNSPEAYKYYLMGMEDRLKNRPDWRIGFQKAVELDPNFAMALWALGGESLKKAMSLSESVSEKEKLFIEAGYASAIEQDRGKAASLYRRIVDKYPKEKLAIFQLGRLAEYASNLPEAIASYKKAVEIDPYFVMAWTQMGYTYFGLDEPEKGLDAYKRAVSARPDYAQALDSLAEGYLKVGRLDEAIAPYNKALQADPGYYPSMYSLSYVYALKEDYPQALRWIDEFLVKASRIYKIRVHFLKALYLFLMGRTDSSLGSVQMAADLSVDAQAGADWFRAWVYYSLGDFDLAQKSFSNAYSAIAASPDVRPSDLMEFRFLDGLIALELKQSARFTSCLKEMESLSSDFTSKYGLERARFDKEWLGALAALKGASPKNHSGILDKAETEVRIPHSGYIDVYNWIIYNTPFQRDALIRNYGEQGEIDKAIALYERRITFDPTSPSRVLIPPLYHYRLAKLYEQKGLKEKAKAQFERFLDLWKDADSGWPEVADAKTRLAGLKGG